MATEIASLFAKVSADASQFQREMGKVKGDLTASEKLANGFGQALKVGLAVGAAAVGALATGIGVATKAAGDMEQQIANIKAVMGLTSDETDKLKQLIMDLGVDPKLKVSAVEAAQAIEMLGRNGMKMTDIMNGAARSTVLLANSTGADFATAADLATDVMAMFNIQASEMDKAVDGITGVTKSSKFSIDDYRLAMAQAGGVASSVGVSFDDFNAVIAATSPLFASGSDAGTSFKTFLQRLVPQSSDAAQAMQDLNLEFFDGAGKMKSMEDIAGQLQRAFGGLSEEQKINAASTMFGTDAMRAAFGMAAAGKDEIARLKAAIGNTSAEEAAATRMDTFAGSIEILRGVMETLTIQVGGHFLPIFRQVAEQLTELASRYGPAVVEWAGRFATRLGEMVTKAQDWIRVGVDVADRVMVIVKAVGDGIKPLTDMIGKWFDWRDILLSVALILGGVVLSAIAGFIVAITPVIVLVAKVAIAVAAMRIAWERDMLGIRTFTETQFGRLLQWWEKYSGTFMQKLTTMSTLMIGETKITVPLFVNNFLGLLRKWYYDAIGWFNMLVHNTKIVLNEWRHNGVTTFQGWVESVKTIFNTGRKHVEVWIENFTRFFKRLYVDLVVIWRDIEKTFKDYGERWFGWFKPGEWLQKGRDLIQGFWDGIRNKWSEFWGWIQGKWGELTQGFKRFFGISSPSKLFMEYGSQLAAGLAIGMDRAMPMVDAAVADMSGTVNVVGSAVEGGGNRTESDLAAAIRALVAALQQQRSGNQINVTMPGGTGNQSNDLAATVQYLQALYA